MSLYVPQRGDIVVTNFNPSAGYEQMGHRPALILSEQPFNERIKLALVAPITSRIRGHGFEVLLQETETGGVVLCHQIKVIDYEDRGIRFIEKAPKKVIEES